MRNLFDAVRSKQLVENDIVEQRHQQLLAMDAHLALMDWESLDTSAGSTPSEHHEDWRSAAQVVSSAASFLRVCRAASSKKTLELEPEKEPSEAATSPVH